MSDYTTEEEVTLPPTYEELIATTTVDATIWVETMCSFGEDIKIELIDALDSNEVTTENIAILIFALIDRIRKGDDL